LHFFLNFGIISAAGSMKKKLDFVTLNCQFLFSAICRQQKKGLALPLSSIVNPTATRFNIQPSDDPVGVRPAATNFNLNLTNITSASLPSSRQGGFQAGGHQLEVKLDSP
jgi:hypothetical protein